ncbi:MAG TPA: hypothetical protein VLH38_03190 [Patescibacteria group bacterium]|nr:hypothetical protein [Patescibacteria group bacterium]
MTFEKLLLAAGIIVFNFIQGKKVRAELTVPTITAGSPQYEKL